VLSWISKKFFMDEMDRRSGSCIAGRRRRGLESTFPGSWPSYRMHGGFRLNKDIWILERGEGPSWHGHPTTAMRCGPTLRT